MPSLRILSPTLVSFTAAITLTVACSPAETRSLSEARNGRGALTVSKLRQTLKAPVPPKAILQLVSYPAPNGKTSAYITPNAGGTERRPAMVWISGGDTALGDFWTPQPRENDQTAAAFREAGFVVFYPSLRGLNANPGQIEGFYGEVDDLVAATAWLKSQPGVDPERVFLGGHSTGGTLVLLAAEFSDLWKGVFAFGPVRDPQNYGGTAPIPIATNDVEGAALRRPGDWLSSVKSPLYVLEGEVRGNADELKAMDDATDNPHIHFVVAKGCDHFSVLRPASEQIAASINAGGLPQSDELAAKTKCQ